MKDAKKILIVGRGAREHALYLAISGSLGVRQVLVAPGNGGIPARDRRDVHDEDVSGIVALAERESVDLVVIGPEKPLVLGVVDALEERGIAAFGPHALAAELEGSKIFMKTLCSTHGIPTAHWTWVDSYLAARDAIRSWSAPPVVKADGLCGGKGVVVARTREEALTAAHDMLVREVYGRAGKRIVIEDCLVGRECSLMAFVRGGEVVPLDLARDYKRVRDGDKGPNTGGMGAYSPLPDVSGALLNEIERRIMRPLARAMVADGRPYQGLLYAGLMLTEEGPQLLECNVRFGDPETQVLLPRLTSGILPYLLATRIPSALSRLGPLVFNDGAAVCTVLASDGYPREYTTGHNVVGDTECNEHALVFHAGTERTPSLVTAGGRVMSIVGLGATIAEARGWSEAKADGILYGNKIRRRDIALGV